MQPVRFAKSSAFYPDLKRRVHQTLEAAGRPAHGGARIALKTAQIFALLTASYVGLVFLATTWWHACIAAFFLGHAIILIGFCVMHDGNHGAFSGRGRVNMVMGHCLDLIGGSRRLWVRKHNQLHHSFTNLEQWDDDLESGGLLRFHHEQPWKPMHRYQVFYAPLLYCLLALHWVISDFPEFFGAKVGRHEIDPPTRGETAVFLAGKALFVTLAFVIPLTQHEPLVVVGFFVGIMMMVGFVMSLVFQLAHVVDEAEMIDHPAEGARLEDDWAAHQLRTTVDFAPNNKLVEWYTGGLNYQAIHHLFSKVSHVNYPIIRETVRETCEAHGLRYRSYPTVRAAIAGHIRRLAGLSRRPEPAAVVAEARA